MSPTPQTPFTPAFSIRLASPEDAADVRRLAALDSAPLPASPLLLGTIDGIPAAATSLPTGATVADPFQRTAALVAMLQLRAEHLKGPGHEPKGAGRLERLSAALRGTRAVA